jgi:hypothetical protein
MLRRKIRNQTDATRCLAEADASGMSRRAWAAANGVDARSLHAWWMNTVARRQPPRESCLRVVELVPADRQDSSRYVIRVGELEVEVGVPSRFL